MATTIYYKLEQLPYGSVRRYASTNKDIVQKGGYPVFFEIYGKERSDSYILADTKNDLIQKYGQNIKLVDLSVGDKSR
ncbi:hypothetical protein FGL85_08465 [Leuconostoc pseudomesenteroides]|uniref:Uncharacterized protein n=1 Tax=Leuconostoc pseudomesenteroides TaxID=33968 RepID=A0A5B8T035_LEUPS|nr:MULTISPECIES: hypothetical protein [Leuconostoc]APE76717.1 hypothetical protein ARA02_05005 [Leuconostoc mesenteroides subsp. jonggajibkimchii]QEA42529.1 hypothetical protein FGL85_08465 [Leuconostoc pseudomesenteroides]